MDGGNIMKVKLVGRCGLYCGACGIFRAQRDNEKKRILIAKEFNCSVEQVKCNGCGALTNECWCNGCKILICLKSKGYEFCYQCSEFYEKSCDKYNKLANTYIKVGEDIRSNLIIIKKGQIDEWLKTQDTRFKCPKCNYHISVWDDICPNCSQKLK